MVCTRIRQPAAGVRPHPPTGGIGGSNGAGPFPRGFVVECPITTEVLIILALILANGVFSMSEIAVVAARKVRLQQRDEDGDERAKAALELAERPAQFLSTVQVGITIQRAAHQPPVWYIPNADNTNVTINEVLLFRLYLLT